MDQVLADTLTANLKTAKTPEEVAKAQTLAMIALVDCQRKTAERVKFLVKAMYVMAALIVVMLVCGNSAAASLLKFIRG